MKFKTETLKLASLYCLFLVIFYSVLPLLSSKANNAVFTPPRQLLPYPIYKT